MSLKTATVLASIPEPARQLSSVLQNLFGIPRSQVSRLIENGCVVVNGRARRQAFHVLNVGDVVSVNWIPDAVVTKGSIRNPSASTSIEFLLDDEDLVVVNKPAKLLTVPTKHREPHTLLSLVERNLQKQNKSLKLFCVHRLDRGVSGVLAIAKSLEIAERLRDQFAMRKPDRRYIALVAGVPKPDRRRLENYLSTDEDLNRQIEENPERGELAITHFETKDSWTDASLLQVRLETGRRNQIRVQLAAIGHPVLGDPRYRPRLAQHWAWPYPRIALHAESLRFHHPRTGALLEFETSWPQEFRNFIRQAGHRSRGS